MCYGMLHPKWGGARSCFLARSNPNPKRPNKRPKAVDCSHSAPATHKIHKRVIQVKYREKRSGKLVHSCLPPLQVMEGNCKQVLLIQMSRQQRQWYISIAGEQSQRNWSMKRTWLKWAMSGMNNWWVFFTTRHILYFLCLYSRTCMIQQDKWYKC